MKGLDKYSKYRQIDCTFLAGFLVLIVTGLMVSWQIPIFTPLFLLYLIYFFATRRSFSLPFFLWPILIITAFYMLGLALSSAFYYRNLADMVNVVIGLAFGFLVWNVAKEQDTIKLLLKRTYTYLFYAVAIISILGIVKLNFTFMGEEISMLWQGGIYPSGTNLIINYNNTSLACFLGLAAGVALIRHSTSMRANVLNTLLLLPITFNLIASGSRRAILLLVLGLVVILSIITVSLFKGGLSIPSPQKVTVYLGLFFLLSVVASSVFMKYLGADGRKALVERLPYDTESFTEETTHIAFRYYTLLYDKSSVSKFHKSLWGKPKSSAALAQLKSRRKETPHASAGRIDRYKYALELYGSFSFGQKLFGDGFNYISQYTEKFLKPIGKSTADYPHNFYLSGLLYSGVLGLVGLLWFSGYLCYKLVRIFKKEAELAIMVLLVWFNILFSYNSIFSLRLFIVLVVLALVVEKRFYSANESSIAHIK